jgi:hypothetical protein
MPIGTPHSSSKELGLNLPGITAELLKNYPPRAPRIAPKVDAGQILAKAQIAKILKPDHSSLIAIKHDIGLEEYAGLE